MPEGTAGSPADLSMLPSASSPVSLLMPLRARQLYSQDGRRDRPGPRAVPAVIEEASLEAARDATWRHERVRLGVEATSAARDVALIAEGHRLVRERLAAGVAPGRYQILAAINAVHTSARDVRDTDWSQVVALYDQLVRLDPSPIVALNRAIAVADRACQGQRRSDRSGLLPQDRCDRLRRRDRVCVPMGNPPTVVFQAKDRGHTQRA